MSQSQFEEFVATLSESELVRLLIDLKNHGDTEQIKIVMAEISRRKPTRIRDAK